MKSASAGPAFTITGGKEGTPIGGSVEKLSMAIGSVNSPMSTLELPSTSHSTGILLVRGRPKLGSVLSLERWLERLMPQGIILRWGGSEESSLFRSRFRSKKKLTSSPE